MTRNVRGFQSVSYLCFILHILTSVEVVHSCFEKNVSKNVANFTSKIIFARVPFQQVSGLKLAPLLK